MASETAVGSVSSRGALPWKPCRTLDGRVKDGFCNSRYTAALLGEPSIRSFPLYVWGRFPGFLVGHSGPLKFKGGHRSPALRAEIPAALARPFADACMAAIVQEATA